MTTLFAFEPQISTRPISGLSQWTPSADSAYATPRVIPEGSSSGGMKSYHILYRPPSSITVL